MNSCLRDQPPAPPRRVAATAAAALVLALVATATPATVRAVDEKPLPPPATRTIDFVKDVKPILEANCTSCHGDKKGSGSYRLHKQDLAFADVDSGRAILPGASAKSSVVLNAARVSDTEMPPDGKGRPLTADQVGILRAWIDQGAKWPAGLILKAGELFGQKVDHWSFKAPVRPTTPAPPAGKHASWPRNPIDNFVLAAMVKQGFTPSPEAERATLVRRATLDLTGLPPTLAEIDAFANDRAPDAYQRMVERLLASPHYGERWGRHWLDLARFADTNGFEKDSRRNIWPYRDWVINAFNRDQPFDSFTIDQLAGDLLPHPTVDQRVATGFLRNSMLNEEGGVEPEQFRIEGIIDRVDAIGKTWLGLTINCVQCHTHKFDPIAHREYYEFFAFLNNDSENEIEVTSPAIDGKRAEILAAVAKAEDAARATAAANDADLDRKLGTWERQVAGKTGHWTVLDDTSIYGALGIKFEKLPDQSYIARGDRSLLGNYVVTAQTKVKGITGFRLELMTDPTLPRGGPGRDADGSAILTEFAVDAAPASTPDAKPRPVPLASASADFQTYRMEIERAIDGDNQTGWSNDQGPGRRNQDRRAVFRTAAPVGFDGGTKLTVTLSQKAGNRKTIGRFRLSVTTDPAPEVDPLPAATRAILAVPPARRTAEQKRALWTAYRTSDGRKSDPRLAEASEKIDKVYAGWPYGPITLALATRETPRVTRMFKRGDFRRPGDVVTPGVPEVLHPFPAQAPRNRLGLARWLVDSKNPLTARVMVNRVWNQYFGQGLVATPEDLGTRAPPASHPELLDWLATEFRDSGWSWKKLHRLILSSATYRQSSRVSPDLYARDAYNRWLARGSRMRVEAETVRDVFLSVSGLLSNKIGGPSVFPLIPAGVMALGYGTQTWETSTGADRHRRGLYTFWKRTVPYPSLAVFDAPAGDFSCPRRLRSNTPLQALTLLNDETFHENAQAFALRMYKEGGHDDRARVVHGFRLATGRKPTDTETRELLSLLAKGQRHFKGDTARAVLVAAADPANPPGGLDLHAVAPWTMVARVILNMDETITRE